MSPAPEIRPRRLGSEGSYVRDLLDGDREARALFPEGVLTDEPGGSPRRPVRLGPDAFETTTPQAEDRLERILEGEGVLVGTGQQPVLFLGPLYLLYKALGAIRLAREIEESTGRPALASFWVASDDHDWPEVGSTRLLDLENRLHTLRLEPSPEREGRSVGPSPLPQAIESRIDELSQLVPESEFVGEYLTLFREAYRPGRTVAEAFGRSLAGVLGDRPLAWLDTARTEVKQASVPLFRRALEDAAGAEAALEGGAARVRSAGYDARIPVLEGGTHLFYDDGETRVRLYRSEGDGFRLGREGRRVAEEAVLEELEREPTRFSPNVALRPVMESWLLPVSHVVLGPGELSYWAELPPLFEHRGVPMPRLRPRPSWTVVEGKIGKVLHKLDAPPDSFRDGGESLIRRAVSDARPRTVDEALRDLRASIQSATSDVEAALEEELPGIRASVGKARSDLFAAVDGLESSVDERVEERQEVLVRQIRKAAAHLHPDGSPQERVLNPLYYLSRYGEGFLDAVEEAGRGRPWLPPSGAAG